MPESSPDGHHVDEGADSHSTSPGNINVAHCNGIGESSRYTECASASKRIERPMSGTVYGHKLVGAMEHQDRREIDPGQGLVTVDHHDQHRIQRRGDRRGHRPRCRGHRPDHSARGLCLRQRCRGGGLPTRRSAILTGINEEPHRRGGHRRNQTTPPEPQSNTPGAVGDPDTASWILDTESPKFPTPYSSLSNPMASLRRMNWRTEVATMGRGRFGIREVDIRYCHDLALFAEEVVPQFSVTEAIFQARSQLT